LLIGLIAEPGLLGCLTKTLRIGGIGKCALRSGLSEQRILFLVACADRCVLSRLIGLVALERQFCLRLVPRIRAGTDALIDELVIQFALLVLKAWIEILALGVVSRVLRLLDLTRVIPIADLGLERVEPAGIDGTGQAGCAGCVGDRAGDLRNPAGVDRRAQSGRDIPQCLDTGIGKLCCTLRAEIEKVLELGIERRALAIDRRAVRVMPSDGIAGRPPRRGLINSVEFG